MQKVINGIALFSGAVSLTLVVGGTMFYLNRDNIVENLKTKITTEITSAITNALPGLIDSAMPEIPEVPTKTGGVIPF